MSLIDYKNNDLVGHSLFFLNANLGESPKKYVKTVNKLLFSLTVITV